MTFTFKAYLDVGVSDDDVEDAVREHNELNPDFRITVLEVKEVLSQHDLYQGYIDDEVGNPGDMEEFLRYAIEEAQE